MRDRHPMVKNEDIEVIRHFIGSNGMYLDTVYAGHFDAIGVPKHRIVTLREFGYIVPITADTYALTLAGVIEAQKMMRPWAPPPKLKEITLDELLGSIDDTERVKLLSAVTTLLQCGWGISYSSVGATRYALILDMNIR